MKRRAGILLGVLAWPAYGFMLGTLVSGGEETMAHPITKNVRTVESLHGLGGPGDPTRIVRARATEVQHQGRLIRVEFDGTGSEPQPFVVAWDPEQDPQNPIELDIGGYDDRGRRAAVAISKEEARILIQSLERMMGQ